MFTKRFLKLPITIEKSEVNVNIGEDKNLTRTSIFILPMQIESYTEAFDDDSTDVLDRVNVRTKAGDYFTVHLTVQEFEQRLNDFEL